MQVWVLVESKPNTKKHQILTMDSVSSGSHNFSLDSEKWNITQCLLTKLSF